MRNWPPRKAPEAAKRCPKIPYDEPSPTSLLQATTKLPLGSVPTLGRVWSAGVEVFTPAYVSLEAVSRCRPPTYTIRIRPETDGTFGAPDTTRP
jgi:hypothetical protein